jgi:hypothetical protein
MDERRQIAMAKLNRRKIDRDLQGFGPGRRFAAGLAQNPFAYRQDEAGPFGDRNEIPGGIRPRLG